MRPGRRVSTGMTLIELIVTVALIGAITAVATLAFPADRTPSLADPRVQIARARATAVQRGTPVAISVVVNGRPVDVYALADGSVITDSTFKLNRLSGRK